MRQEFRGYGVFMFLAGIALFIVAAMYAAEGRRAGTNNAAGLAALGFAVAGGLTFVAAAIVYVGDRLAEWRIGDKRPAPPRDRGDVPEDSNP